MVVNVGPETMDSQSRHITHNTHRHTYTQRHTHHTHTHTETTQTHRDTHTRHTDTHRMNAG